MYAFAFLAAALTVVDGGGYFPVMTRLHDGRLAAVYRGGAPHIGRGGRLDWTTSSDAGKTWSKPQTLVDGPEDDRNPGFGQLRDGTIILAYAVLSGYDATGTRLSQNRSERIFDGVYTIRSSDGGKTWSKAVKHPGTSLPPGSPTGTRAAVSPYGKIVQLADGTALMAVYYEATLPDGTQRFQSWVYRSKDSGKTWTDPALIQLDGNETSLVVLRSGTVLAAVRTSRAGFLQVTRSQDGGRTWSKPTAVTKNAEHPADVIQLSDGRLAMTFGQRNPPRGVHALVSSDEGLSWSPPEHIVLASDAPNVDCGYPSSVELQRGEIATLYYQVDDTENALASSKAKLLFWTPPPR
jgi:Neuraminidase (sialidase)